MSAVSLLCNTNMAAICCHVHTFYTLLWCVDCFLIVKIHYYFILNLLTKEIKRSDIPTYSCSIVLTKYILGLMFT